MLMSWITLPGVIETWRRAVNQRFGVLKPHANFDFRLSCTIFLKLGMLPVAFSRTWNSAYTLKTIVRRWRWSLRASLIALIWNKYRSTRSVIELFQGLSHFQDLLFLSVSSNYVLEKRRRRTSGPTFMACVWAHWGLKLNLLLRFLFLIGIAWARETINIACSLRALTETEVRRVKVVRSERVLLLKLIQLLRGVLRKTERLLELELQILLIVSLDGLLMCAEILLVIRRACHAIIAATLAQEHLGRQSSFWGWWMLKLRSAYGSPLRVNWGRYLKESSSPSHEVYHSSILDSATVHGLPARQLLSISSLFCGGCGRIACWAVCRALSHHICLNFKFQNNPRFSPSLKQ